jgi:AcrR family transcriptional regulator
MQAMQTPRNPTRQRLVDSALALFAQHGITETATKQIAELAEVNEVTLFRQFGNKQGLVLAILEEEAVFDRLAQTLGSAIDANSSPEQALREYAQSYLDLLNTAPEMLRSMIGEAGKSPVENRQALGQGLHRTNTALAKHLGNDRLASLVNITLLGYAVLEMTTEFHGLWADRDGLIQDLVALVLSQPVLPAPLPAVQDLPASLVQTIFRRAQKQGAEEFALVYLLFGAGISPGEIAGLQRVHHLSDRQGQFLQITSGAVRQVPVNQWIMGKRYGTAQKNPLTQWLRERKDDQPALLITTIESVWPELTRDLLTLDGKPPTIVQARYTWGVEMLSRGMSLEDLQILIGMPIEQLIPYGNRAKQKAVLEQGVALDRQK